VREERCIERRSRESSSFSFLSFPPQKDSRQTLSKPPPPKGLSRDIVGTREGVSRCSEGERAGGREKKLARLRAKVFCVCGVGLLSTFSSVLDLDLSSFLRLFRWRPPYSSRLRLCRQPAAAPAAAGPSHQRQHHRRLVLALPAAAGGNNNKLEKGHRSSSPLLLPMLNPLLPPRPLTSARPRRASSATPASSSGTRRW
jgi:hypothetical protein